MYDFLKNYSMKYLKNTMNTINLLQEKEFYLS